MVPLVILLGVRNELGLSQLKQVVWSLYGNLRFISLKQI